MKGKTESEIAAAQDQALQTKYHATNILHTHTHRQQTQNCKQLDETVEHIACPILAKEQYIKRHDKSVCSTTL